jgi:hypothetical protein
MRSADAALVVMAPISTVILMTLVTTLSVGLKPAILISNYSYNVSQTILRDTECVKEREMGGESERMKDWTHKGDDGSTNDQVT